MAQIPDRLMRDIRQFFEKFQGCNTIASEHHNRFMYAIDLCVEYNEEPVPHKKANDDL